MVLWDVATRQPRLVLKGHTDSITHVAFAPDGKTLASASGDGSIFLWNSETGEQQATLRGHTWPVAASRSAPTGTPRLRKLGYHGDPVGYQRR